MARSSVAASNTRRSVARRNVEPRPDIATAVDAAIAASHDDRGADHRELMQTIISFREVPWPLELEERLRTIPLRPGKSAAEVATAHGLDLKVICELAFSHRLALTDRDSYSRDSKSLDDAARAITAAAAAIRELATLAVPEREGDLLAHPLAGSSLTPEFDAIVASLCWRSPLLLPSALLATLAGAQGSPDGRFDWADRGRPDPQHLIQLSYVLKDLAMQLKGVAGSVAPSASGGRPVALGAKLFRAEFARYAKSKCERNLDDLGAVIFSNTFQSIEPEEYSRLRRREAKDAGQNPTP